MQLRGVSILLSVAILASIATIYGIAVVTRAWMGIELLAVPLFAVAFLWNVFLLKKLLGRETSQESRRMWIENTIGLNVVMLIVSGGCLVVRLAIEFWN